MSAGSGVTHSEFNPSATEAAHFLQIWILPRERKLTPRYTDATPATEAATGKLLLISPDGRDGSATIAQDAEVHRLRLAAGEKVSHTLTAGRGAWIQVIRGSLELDGATGHRPNPPAAMISPPGLPVPKHFCLTSRDSERLGTLQSFPEPIAY
ncbi:MAG: pirin family protein [Akkermansiaceae bacterium]|nr:pirin family protein [Akkermansiaceae bacterium]